tara:strand:+ start:577 stop:1482 length:906 start_codon:yes stop_codon:yes gene_type:complete
MSFGPGFGDKYTNYMFGKRDNLLTTRSFSEDIFGRTTGGGAMFGGFDFLQQQMQNMGQNQEQPSSQNNSFNFSSLMGGKTNDMMNFGKQFGSLSDLSSKMGQFKGLESIGSLAGGLGKGLASAVTGGLGALKGAAMANPVGAALAVGSKIFSVGSKTKEAKAQSKVLGSQIDDTKQAIVDAGEVNIAEKEIIESNRDMGIEQGGEKLSEQGTMLDLKGEQAYLQTGGLKTSGDIEFTQATGEEKLAELAVDMEQLWTQKFEQGTADSDARFDQFQDQAQKQIAELQKQKSSLKTKWYQNII